MDNIYNNGLLVGRISSHIFKNEINGNVIGGKFYLAVLTSKKGDDGKFITDFFPITYEKEMAKISAMPKGTPLIVRHELTMEKVKDYKYTIPQINCISAGKAPQTRMAPPPSQN